MAAGAFSGNWGGSNFGGKVAQFSVGICTEATLTKEEADKVFAEMPDNVDLSYLYNLAAVLQMLPSDYSLPPPVTSAIRRLLDDISDIELAPIEFLASLQIILEHVEHENALSWLRKAVQGRQNADGGFGIYPGDPSDFCSTYLNVRLLTNLGLPFDRNAVLTWLLSHKLPQGGFSMNDYGAFDLDATFYALHTLVLMSETVKGGS